MTNNKEQQAGISTLQNVIECLRETGRYVDDEGESTNELEGLLAKLTSQVASGEAVAWNPLSDVQWMNIVNHDRAWDSYSKDEAIHEAVKMTEAKCKEMNASHANVLAKELKNISEAKRFNREFFTDDSAFADWAQSRARHTLAAYESNQPILGNTTTSPSNVLVEALLTSDETRQIWNEWHHAEETAQGLYMRFKRAEKAKLFPKEG